MNVLINDGDEGVNERTNRDEKVNESDKHHASTCTVHRTGYHRAGGRGQWAVGPTVAVGGTAHRPREPAGDWLVLTEAIRG